MKIDSDNQIFGIAVFVFAIFVFTAVNILDLFISTIILGIGLLFCGMYLVAFGREIELNEEGIQISFFCYHKTIRWKDISKICLINTAKCVGYRFSSSLGVEIYIKAGDRPAKLAPNTYCLFRRPMSYIFISFKGTIQHHNIKYPEYYTADENQLLGMLRKYYTTD